MMGLVPAAGIVGFGLFIIQSDGRAVRERHLIRDEIATALRKSDERDDVARKLIMDEVRCEFRRLRDDLGVDP